MTSATLYHVIKQTVRAAQRMIFCDKPIMTELSTSSVYQDYKCKQKDAPTFDLEFDKAIRRGEPTGRIPRSEVVRRMVGWRIRLVIDNWTTLEEMYPEVKSDPLFLLCLLFFLRREGIATLIVANEDRGFSAGFNLQQNRRLRDQTAIHLFTWRTPFFGESRVAITVNPPMGRLERFDAIRELRRLSTDDHIRSQDDRLLAVSPYFELFAGLENGDPKYVPLRIRLIEPCPTGLSYLADVQNLFGWLLDANADADPGATIITCEQVETYERLRDFSQIQGNSRFPYTLVTQIDEFWAKTGPLHFQRVKRYLEALTARTEETAGTPRCMDYVVEDPLNVFQPSALQVERLRKSNERDDGRHRDSVREWSRLDFFTPPGYSLRRHLETNAETIIKVPYTWDFGFLMCHRDAWEEASYDEKKRFEKERSERERSESPRSKTPRSETPTPIERFWKAPPGYRPSWREFVEACVAVARFASGSMGADRPRGFSTFGIAPEIQESLSCLLLEIWASEGLKLAGESEASPFMTKRHDPESMYDLRAIIKKDEYRKGLLLALCLLYDLVPPSLLGMDHRLKAGEDPDAVPVAARAWYSSASPYQNRPSVKDWFVPKALPGSFSTRGDWFLGIVRGSRSPRLGERAIDLLSTRRGNILRLQLGIGLPVRDNLEDAIELWTSLRKIDDWGNPTGRYSYGDLVRFGGPLDDGTAEPPSAGGPRGGAAAPKAILQGGPLHWLWRSRIRHYDRHARILRRWTCAILLKLREQLGQSGVAAYDKYSGNNEFPKGFPEEVNALRDTLGRATIS